MNNAVIPLGPCSKLTAFSSALPGSAFAGQASAASFPRYCCRCTSFIQGPPVLLLASGDRRLLLFLLCDAFLHSACPDPVGTSLRYILFFFPPYNRPPPHSFNTPTLLHRILLPPPPS